MTSRIFRPRATALPLSSGLRRTPPRVVHERQPGYAEQYDDRTLFYDVHRVDDELLLCGPPLRDLAPVLGRARFSVDGTAVSQGVLADGERTQRSRLVLPQEVTAAGTGAPSTLRVQGEGLDLHVPVSSDEAALFAGRRVLTTLSKDNDLRWVGEWLAFYADRHATDAVLVYDNASSAYTREELLAALSGVAGIAVAVVVDWPHAYGPDGGPSGLWDSDYCQYGYLENARWRFLRKAAGVISCDVDELALSSSGRTLYDAAASSREGAVVFPGTWVDAVRTSPAPDRYPTFGSYVFTNPTIPACNDKWAAVPDRLPPSTQWRVHNLLGTPVDLSEEFRFRHFRAVSTGWKRDCGAVAYDPSVHEVDRPWLAATAPSC